ncbi:MAG: zf-HC2 domain-containing protein [Candidatus Omnitrophica bacterium]|nr:zf-HC2 domain-containing protein [Candidatus Omnitrophota bacterium]MBU4149921.1 zf-HC2 domain-containing protein [Candidatus Omnitrophota bacterium]
MNCKDIKQMFFVYIDGELEAEKERIVVDHIASCEKCRVQLYEYKRSWEMLGTLEPIEPTPGYISRFWTALSYRLPWYEKILEGIRNLFLPRRVVYRVALALIVLIAVYVSVDKYTNVLRTRTLLVNMSEEEWEVVENYDLIANLDLLESLKGIENIKL